MAYPSHSESRLVVISHHNNQKSGLIQPIATILVVVLWLKWLNVNPYIFDLLMV